MEPPRRPIDGWNLAHPCTPPHCQRLHVTLLRWAEKDPGFRALLLLGMTCIVGAETARSFETWTLRRQTADRHSLSPLSCVDRVSTHLFGWYPQPFRNHMPNTRLIPRLLYRHLQCYTTMSARPPPTAPLLVILGSTGTGKSEVKSTHYSACRHWS